MLEIPYRYTDSPPDCMTHEGAKALAVRILSYWLDRGCLVNVSYDRVGDDSSGLAIWAVRSDLVGGLPAAMRARMKQC